MKKKTTPPKQRKAITPKKKKELTAQPPAKKKKEVTAQPPAKEYVKELEQLELFSQLMDGGDYSSTIELFDRIPLFLPDKRIKKGTPNKPLEVRKASFTHRPRGGIKKGAYDSVRFQVFIKPAQLVQNGKTNTFLPSQREQFVEIALRRLAIKKIERAITSLVRPDEANEGSRFFTILSVYDLRKELAENSHAYTYKQILEAMDILSNTLIELKTEDERYKYTKSASTIIRYERIEDSKDNDGGATHYRVWFHPFVQDAIQSESYRRYDVCAEYKLGFLARWLHKRLAHNYIQAGDDTWYSIKMSTILEESGLTPRKPFRNNQESVEDALRELFHHDILGDPPMFSPKRIEKFGNVAIPEGWHKETNYENIGGKKRLTDVTYHLFTSDNFNHKVRNWNTLRYK